METIDMNTAFCTMRLMMRATSKLSKGDDISNKTFKRIKNYYEEMRSVKSNVEATPIFVKLSKEDLGFQFTIVMMFCKGFDQDEIDSLLKANKEEYGGELHIWLNKQLINIHAIKRALNIQ